MPAVLSPVRLLLAVGCRVRGLSCSPGAAFAVGGVPVRGRGRRTSLCAGHSAGAGAPHPAPLAPEAPARHPAPRSAAPASVVKAAGAGFVRRIPLRHRVLVVSLTHTQGARSCPPVPNNRSAPQRRSDSPRGAFATSGGYRGSREGAATGPRPQARGAGAVSPRHQVRAAGAQRFPPRSVRDERGISREPRRRGRQATAPGPHRRGRQPPSDPRRQADTAASPAFPAAARSGQCAPLHGPHPGSRPHRDITPP
jgi:hypothetical protein